MVEYNTERPHQSCGGRPPAERFALAERVHRRGRRQPDAVEPAGAAAGGPARGVSAGGSNSRGRISLAGFDYRVGATFAGEPVEVVVTGGLVEILHAGVLVATHAQRLQARPGRPGPRASRLPVQRRARDATTGLTVTRLADGSGCGQLRRDAVSRAGGAGPGRASQVAIVAGSVQLAVDGQVIRVHPIRHDRSRELGAFANPKADPAARPQPA